MTLTIELIKDVPQIYIFFTTSYDDNIAFDSEEEDRFQSNNGPVTKLTIVDYGVNMMISIYI